MLSAIEVFKTDVTCHEQAKLLIVKLQQLFPGSCVNFDLEDCDRVLRVKGQNICMMQIMQLLKANGHQCTALA